MKDMAMPAKVMVTGGAGFIGSHLAEALLRQGIQLTIVDSLDDFYTPSRKLSNLESVRQQGEFQFFGVPLKFKGGSGSPVRAFAIVSDPTT